MAAVLAFPFRGRHRDAAAAEQDAAVPVLLGQVRVDEPQMISATL